MAIDEGWPELPYGAWRETCTTLHLWSQVVGKVALALAPPLNHCWGSALHITARGLSTRLLPCGTRAFTLAFDFIDHALVIDCTDGQTRRLPLEPRSVADFHDALMGALRAMGLAVRIWPVAVEMPSPVRLDQDTRHHTYEPAWAHRFWWILVQVGREFARWRCSYVGKSSPVNFFWGSFDLAVTRFSGRRAPPREGPAFEREAYSHEVISHGFWPGSAPLPEPAFYAYAVPQPAGLAEAPVQPGASYFHPSLGEFILPYEAVRTATSPEAALRAFLQSTWRRAAELGGWNLAELERH
ncbi:hypothetical protein J7I44_09410 [Frateuria sp. MAH-13]|uniref:Ava_C0101 and related proteins n=1 Tax=Frateuria flava TaxID=2821489 RepID=A0ABS4DN94_9GAMM|nr:DUF5996 family protein [Frateuria flava]MBP1474520.1 hypothetical protein [Frateuria flava]